MGVIGGLLVLVGLVGIVVGLATVVRPIRWLRITNRKFAGGLLASSFAVMLIGTALVPTDRKDESGFVLGEKGPNGAVSPTPGETTTESPPVTASATPVASATSVATPTATATPQSLEGQIEKSVRDNRNAVSGGANLDNLVVVFDSPTGLLQVSITPNKPEKDTQFITNGSALAIISGKAVWTTYGEVRRLSVQVFREVKDDRGNLFPEQMALADYSRENGLKYNYANLKNQPEDDNKLMYCTADFYAVSERVWNAIKDKGCLTARVGGNNPTDEQKAFVLSLPTPSPTAGPTAVPTQRPSNQAKIGNLLLTVNAVNPSYVDSLFPAESGTHYVAVDISARNTGSSTYALNVFNFRLKDSSGFTNSTALTEGPEPRIGHHELTGDQEVRGFLVFKVKDGAIPVELQYQSFTGTPGRIPLAPQ